MRKLLQLALLLTLAAPLAHAQVVLVGGSKLTGNAQLTCLSNAPTPSCAAPTASPAPGTYTTSQSISLATTTANAAICYTTDGSTPTSPTQGQCGTGTTLYSAPFTVSASTTVNAIATESGYLNSALFSGSYTIQSGTQVAAPVLQVASGTVYPQPVRVVYGMQDDTTTDWGSCSGPTCAGGTGTPTSISQTISNTSPALDGDSMLLSMTTSQASSNALWYDKQAAFCAGTTFHSDMQVYPEQLTGISALEYDIANICTTSNTKSLFAIQWNQAAAVWDVWNQNAGTWVATSVTEAPSARQWNRIELWAHNVPGDTSACSGSPCMYYDVLSINGTRYSLNMTEPAGVPASGDASTAALQFKIASDSTTTTATTLGEYIDQASLTVSNTGAWITEPTAGATVYYTETTDGTTPGTPGYDSTSYLPVKNTLTFIAGQAGSSGAPAGVLFIPDFEVWGNLSLKLMAAKEGMTDSAITSGSYSIAAPTGTAVANCETLPTTAGTYYLTGNLTSPGTCIQFGGTNQYLDLNGYTITYGTANGSILTGTDANTTSGSTSVACPECTTAMVGDRMVVDNYNLGGYQNNSGDDGLDPTIQSVTSGVATLSHAPNFTATGAHYVVWAPEVYGVLCNKNGSGGYNCNGSEVYNGTISDSSVSPANSEAVSFQPFSFDYPNHGGNTFANLTLNVSAPEAEAIYVGQGLHGDAMLFNTVNDSATLIYARDGLPYPFKFNGGSQASSSPENLVAGNKVYSSPQGDTYANYTTWSVNNYYSNGPTQYANGFGEFFAASNSRVTGDSINGNTQGVEEEASGNVLEATNINVVTQKPVNDPNHNMPGCELGFPYREKDFHGSTCPTTTPMSGQANVLGCGPVGGAPAPGTGVLLNNSIIGNFIYEDSGQCGTSGVEFTETYGNDNTLVENNNFVLNMSTDPASTPNPSELFSWDFTNAEGLTYTGNTYSITGAYAAKGQFGFFNYDQVINLTLDTTGVASPAFTWRQGANWYGCPNTGGTGNCTTPAGINMQNVVLTGSGTPTCAKIPNTTLSSFEATFNGTAMTCPQ